MKSKQARRKKPRTRRSNEAWGSRKHAFTVSLSAAWILSAAAFGVIAFVIFKNDCNSMREKIAKAEANERELMERYSREFALWEELKAPATLRGALQRHGLHTLPAPNPAQRVAMGPIFDRSATAVSDASYAASGR
jgi:hypothetical protein